MADSTSRAPRGPPSLSRRMHSRRKTWVNRLLKGEISTTMLKRFEHKEQMLAEAARLLGQATDLYILGPARASEAVALLRQTIALNPTFEAFSLLAELYDGKGDGRSQQKATELWMLAAHLRNTDGDLWKRVHARYLVQGQIDEACYCIKRAAACIARSDPDASGRLLQTKAELHLAHGHPWSKAVATLKALLHLRLTDSGLREDALLLLAELYHKHEQAVKAIQLLTDHLEQCDPQHGAYPTRVALMACEVHMERGFFREALDLLTAAVTRVFRCSLRDLPPEFLSKAIVCELYLDKRHLADQHAAWMLSKWPLGPTVTYAEPYYDVARAYCDVGEYESALRTFEGLLCHETFQQPNLQYQIGRCYLNLQQVSTAMEHLEAVLAATPEHVGARLSLSKAVRDVDPDRAVELLFGCPEERAPMLDAVRLALERTRLLAHLRRYPEVHASALPVLRALLRTPPPATVTSSRSVRTELSMRSTMSRLISSQFVLSRFDVLPEGAATQSDVLSQSALSTMSMASTFAPRPTIDAPVTLFGHKARGGPGSRKRVRDEAFPLDSASQVSQHTGLADLEGMSDAGGNDDDDERGSASEGGYSSAGSSEAPSDWDIPDAPELTGMTAESLRDLARARWHWGIVTRVLRDEELLEWLFLVCQAMAEAEQYAAAAEFLRSLLAAIPNSDRFRDQQGQVGHRLRRLLLGFSVMLGDYDAALDVMRGLFRRDAASGSDLWNVYAHVAHKTGQSKTGHAILTKVITTHPTLHPALVLVAHFHLTSGAAPVALRYYREAFRQRPNDPLVHLCIGVASLCKAISRATANRHALVAHALAFFERYSRSRSEDLQQEVQYNLGRAYHFLGLTYLAVPHYWRVLELAGTSYGRGLHREAAYNLHHIYLQSGNRALAAQVLRDHCFL
jgi:tetratricopeptide (TPR) repeat protein